MSSLSDLMSRAARLDAPLGVHWTVTHACNLRCAHCYQPSHRAGADELSLDEARRVLGEMADAGVLFLTFSGGEVFARKDFLELVAEARRRRFAVTVYSNGTLLDEARAAALADLGVLRVEVSLHSHEAAGHDGFVGKSDAFQSTRRAVELLAARGVRVVVKTSVTAANAGDCERVPDLFSHLQGVTTSRDTVLFPRDDGDLAPTELIAESEPRRRLAAREVAAISPDTLARMAARLDSAPRARSAATCAAGRASVAIQPNGDVTPCTIWSRVLGNVRAQPFLEIWNGQKRAVAQKATTHALLGATKECSACSYGAVCSFCPALSLRETGSETGRSPQVCDRTTLRWTEIEKRLGRTPHPPPPPVLSMVEGPRRNSLRIVQGG